MFRKVAHFASEKLGSPWAFVTAFSLIVIWAVSGPFLDYSTTWQPPINTVTTVLTFLMVFLIQNTQDRDARAIHLKLDELIKSIDPARNILIDIEDMETRNSNFCRRNSRDSVQQRLRKLKRSGDKSSIFLLESFGIC